MENALPRRFWSLCMTSENHGTVGPAGCTFSHAPEKHERVLVVEAPAGARAPVAEFKGYVDGEPAVTWLDRDNMPRVGTKLFAHAAANKAAEEGGLPALKLIQKLNGIAMCLASDLVNGTSAHINGHDYLGRDYVCERVIQWRAEWDAISPEVHALSEKLRAADRASRQDHGPSILRDMLVIQEVYGLHTDEYAPGSVIEYIKELEAESASRQVANKAEVEPLTATHGPVHMTNRKTAEIANTDYNITGYVLRREDGDAVCISAESAVRWLPEAHYWRLMHEQDGSLFATPPATTGASTAVPIEITAALGLFESASVAESVKAIRTVQRNAFLAPLGASTVLTDERIAVICAEIWNSGQADFPGTLARAIEREVAAQAGQVAVPEAIMQAARSIRDEQAAACATDPLLALREMAADDEEALVSARLLVDLLEAIPSPEMESK